MSRIFAAVTVCAVVILFAGSPARAQSRKDTRKASAHYRQGKAYVQQELWDKAIAEYRAAYALVPKPELFYNIARALHEKGDKKAALEHYRKYLAADPLGRVADESREFIASLEKELAAVADAERARIEKERLRAEAAAAANKRAEADGHRKQAVAYAGGNLPDKAITEYEAAFSIDGDAEVLYEIAELKRARRDKDSVEAYLRYLGQGQGARNDEARKWVVELTRQRDDASRLLQIEKAKADAKPRNRRNWKWIAIGAALVGAGVAADWIPGASRNGTLEGTDFVGLGLYSVGATFVSIGVF